MKGKSVALMITGFLLGGIAVMIVMALYSRTVPTVTPTPTPTPTIAQLTPTPSTTGNDPLSARVKVSEPRTGARVQKTFTIKGEAPGNWYFEASFPIQVRDPEGTVIGRTVAQAKSDWMTTAQVPFQATVTVNMAYHGPATLILLKDNPSGLPEHDDSVSFEITIQ